MRYQDPKQLLRQLKIGREEFCQRLITKGRSTRGCSSGKRTFIGRPEKGARMRLAA